MTAAARDVFFVDLSGTTDNRRVLRGFSKLLIAASTLSRRILRRQGPRVLVFAPAADGKSVDWPDGAELIFTDELLDPATVARINQWVLDLSARMIRDPQLWPSWNGVSLGRLNLYEIQLFLMKYAQATEGLRILMDREPGGRCVVVSGYPDMARAIRADVAGRTARVKVRALPSYRPPFLYRNGTASGEPAVDAIRGLRTRALMVSESKPMAGLFSPVEEQLAKLGVGPNLRIQYDANEHGFEKRAGTSILHLTRPEGLPVRRVAEFDAAPLHERFVQVTAEMGSYRPPLRLLHDSLVSRIFPRQIRHLDLVGQILERARPDVVVVGNDRWWIGMSYVLVARQMGIPTLAVQDGVAWETPMWTGWTADQQAVNGPQLERVLVGAGVPRDRITVVGQPRYDGFNPAAAGAVRDGARRAIGLAPGTFAVLLATQPNQDALYARRVADAILAVPQVHLLLRPHPSTSPLALAELERINDGPRVTSVPDPAIFDMIAASDLVVVQNSTVALEAALLDRPVISANFTGLPDVVSYADFGLCVEATTTAEVTGLVRQAVEGRLPTTGTDDAARAGLFQLIGPTDGRSAERVATLVGKTLDAVRTAT